MSALLADLVNVRSQLAEDLARYYESVIEALDTTRWYRNNDFIKTSDIAIPVRVLKEDPRPRPEREGRGPGGKDRQDGDGSREDRTRDYIDPEIARLYEAPTHEKRTVEVAWDSERSQIKRALILGAPGGGKSFLTQRLAVEIARTALEDLNAQRRPIDMLPVPIHVECGELGKARRNTDLAGGLIDLLQTNTDRYETTPRLLDWLRPRVITNHVWLILDALDQIADDQDKQNFLSWLKAFQTQRWQSSIVVTCRTANYDRTEIPWMQCAEYELAPFRPQEIKTFIGRWFGKHDAKGKSLAQVLERSYSLSHACGTPIVLTLTCLAHEEQAVTEHTRRVDLYNTVLIGLVRRAWKTNPLPRDETHIDDMLDFLEQLAKPLFEASPRANLFANPAVMAAIRAIENRPLPWILQESFKKGQVNAGVLAHEAKFLRDELADNGILIKAGRNSEKKVQWSFLHRSFLEYLAACALAREVETKGWQATEGLVSRMAWLPEWQEVIVLLAGLLEDPGPLLEMLGNPKPTRLNPYGDDYFRHRLILACVSIGEIAPEIQDRNSEQLDTMTKQALDLWSKLYSLPQRDSWRSLANRVVPAIVIPARSVAQWRARHIDRMLVVLRNNKFEGYQIFQQFGSSAPETVINVLLVAFRDHDRDVRVRVAGTLGLIGLGTETVIRALLEALHDDDDYVRRTAAKALGRIGQRIGTETVIRSLLADLRDHDMNVRRKAAENIGLIGPGIATETVVNALLAALRGSNWYVRNKAAVALGQLGPGIATETVVDALLATMLDNDGNVLRDSAAEALGLLGPGIATETVIEALLVAWRDGKDGYSLRLSATEALARLSPGIRTEIQIQPLLESLRDGYKDVRRDVAYTLGRLGPGIATDGVIQSLLVALGDNDQSVRSSAAGALGRLGPGIATDTVIQPLLVALRDKDDVVRYCAVEALGGLGPGIATDTLIQSLLVALGDKDDLVRMCAAKTLGLLGPRIVTETVIQALLMMALRDKLTLVREKAAEAMGRLRPGIMTETAIQQTLLAALQDNDSEVRCSAAKALGQLGPGIATKTIIQALFATLRDRNVYICDSAAKALGRLGPEIATETVIQGLLDALRDHSWSLRYEAANALSLLMRSGLRVFETHRLPLWKIHNVSELSAESQSG